MSITYSPHYSKVLSKEIVDLGTLYFFKNFLVAEFNEGVIIGFENFNETRAKIETYFGNKNFGFIANRKHSYSIVITDASQFNRTFKNLKAYATVTYSTFASKVFEMENHFFDFNRQNFGDLDDAIRWTEENLKELD